MLHITASNWRNGRNIPAFIRIEFNKKGTSVTCMAVKWGGYFKKLYTDVEKEKINECKVANSEFLSGMIFGMLDNIFEREYAHMIIDDITKLFKPYDK
ncbi:MAG: hypothetical protein LBC82_03550 [Oscillospiraceae bacterium]|jgi:hypothetical protein|nr:hypothetical protein [Oscillospiraceae bacterium]